MAGIALFEDIFAVKNKNPDGQKFMRVTRLECLSENYEMELLIDIQTMIYPIELNERFTLAIANSLQLSGTPDDGVYDQSNKPSLADKFEYVMHGRVYRCEEEKGSSSRLSVFVSYGGLLMRLKGDARNLLGMHLDSDIYVLIRKV